VHLGTLSEVYAIEDTSLIHQRLTSGLTSHARLSAAVALYLECLSREYKAAGRPGYTAAIPINSIDGQFKYFMVVATGDYLGIKLASDNTYAALAEYKRQYEEFKVAQTGQLLLTGLTASQEEIDAERISAVEMELSSRFSGEQPSRREIHKELLRTWFGRITGRHVTAALKRLEEIGCIVSRSGARSDETTVFRFTERCPELLKSDAKVS
jgi:hypothetical protein